MLQKAANSRFRSDSKHFITRWTRKTVLDVADMPKLVKNIMTIDEF